MNNKEKTKQILPYIFIVIGAILMFIHTKYSFCASDESFYASTTNRFLQGDAIFVHEWFPTQLVSLILLPIQGAFKVITGSNDGILLFMRRVYVIFSAFSSVIIYRLINKKYNKFCACICALFVMFYAHLNIATMSYYTLSFHFFLLAMLLLMENGRFYYILSGICIALAVLSLPSLALVYFLIMGIYVLYFVFCKIKGIKVLFFDQILYSLIGILIPAIPVLLYVLPTSGLMGIIDNLQYVLSDEEHITSVVAPFKKFFTSITDVFGKSVYLTVLLTIISFGIFIYRDIMKKSATWLVSVVISVFVLDIFVAFYNFRFALGHTGYISTLLIMFALPAFFLSERKNYPMFSLVFIGGLIFSMVYSYSSNGDLYVLSIGHSIAAIAGICMLFDINKGTLHSDFWKILISSFCIACILLMFNYRWTYIYRDAPLIALTEKIEHGPAKGLYTTKEHKEQYEEILSVIKENEGKGNAFFTKLLPWGYLATTDTCGAPTTWRTKFSSERLRLYYSDNPNKIPDVIYILPPEAGAYNTCGDVIADPVPNENETDSGFLYEHISEYKETTKNGIRILTKIQ